MFDNILLRACPKAATTHLSCLGYWEWWACFLASGKQSLPLWSTPKSPNCCFSPWIVGEESCHSACNSWSRLPRRRRWSSAIALSRAGECSVADLTHSSVGHRMKFQDLHSIDLSNLSHSTVSLERRNWNHKPLLETPAVLLGPIPYCRYHIASTVLCSYR